MEDRSQLLSGIEPELLTAAEKIMDSLGLSLSLAIRVCIKRIVAIGGLPFSLYLCIKERLQPLLPGRDLWYFS